MVFKFVFKLVTKFLTTNILDFKIVSKRLIKTNIKYIID